MTHSSIVRVSGPAEELISRAQAKLQARVDSDLTADDDLIDSLVAAAREDCEAFTRLCFVWSEYELRLDEFPASGDYEIRLPYPPLIRVNWIRYVDSNGAEQSLGSGAFQVDTRSRPGRVRPPYASVWPTARDQMAAVTVSYTAGFPVNEAGSPTDYIGNVPASIVAAVKLRFADLYRNRGDRSGELPVAVKLLLWKHRVDDLRLSHA